MSTTQGAKVLAMMSALTLISGCGINTLRVEYAGSVAEQGKAAGAASRNYLDRIDTARDEANADLFAADPACGRSPEAIVRGMPRPKLTPLVRGWLCVPDGEGVGPNDSRLSLRPLAKELEPTVALIDALASYSDSLAEIVEAKPSDPVQGFNDALDTARAAQGALALIVHDLPAVPGANDPRVKDVSDFIGFLGELDFEAGQVKQLRQVILKHPDGAEAIIASLRDQLGTWELRRKADLDLRQTLAVNEVQRVRNAVPPVSDEERRAAMLAFYAGIRNYRDSAKIQPALDRLLVALLKSDQDLRRVLRDNPNLSEKERRKVAEINRKRLIRALESVTALITSFKGA